MQFVHRLKHIWSWLPAFRAVAETQHLPTAAHELDLVPSALSRTIKLLEDELGVTLFDRSGKSLVLNDAGKGLLVAVRDAMRLVDDAIAIASTDDVRGSVTAAACSDLAQLVIAPACAELATKYPQLRASSIVAPSDALAGMLVRGDVDVAVLLHPVELPELQLGELASWSRAVYGRAPGQRCVVVGPPSDRADDGWPVDRERTIAVWAHDQRAALEIAARSDLVTVAFDALGRSSEYAGRVSRLPDFAIAPHTLYIAHRKAIGAHRRTEALVAAIRTVVRR